MQKPGSNRFLFDQYVMVDWSASRRPCTGENSVWIGSALTTEEPTPAVDLRNPPTRGEAFQALHSLLREAVGRQRRVLVGFDVPFGYPRGLSGHIPGGEPPWRSLWNYLLDHVEDDSSNRNNRFRVAEQLNRIVGDGPGPLWGRPPGMEGSDIPARKPERSPCGIPNLRFTDRRLARAQSPLKLFGAGSCGSQMICGIPYLERLRTASDLRSRIEVWPFETGLYVPRPDRPGEPLICLSEIFAPMGGEEPDGHSVRDARQVKGMIRLLMGRDRENSLSGWFSAPGEGPSRRIDTIRRDEGWILGVE